MSSADPVLVTFERADESRSDTLLDLMRAYYEHDRMAFDRSAMARGVAALIADPGLGGAWLICRKGDAIGYFVLTMGFDLEFGGRQATVTELFLRSDARGSGIGRATIAFIEDHLATLGIAAYELQVLRENLKALAFYRRLGFTAHDRIPMSKEVGRRVGSPTTSGPALARDTVDHISLGTNDLAAATRFYDAALAPLGFRRCVDGEHEVGYYRQADLEHRDAFALFIGFEDAAARHHVAPSAGFHLAFRATNRASVIAFYDAALRAGGRDNGAPGLRPAYHRDYFGAFVIDPDGHHVEAVCHMPH